MIIKYLANMIFLLISLSFCTNTFSSHATDTISPNQTLSGNQTIVSSNGNFELGFFSPGNSSKHYIAIWYKKISPKTTIWIANRETPISDENSAQLRVLDGNLVLLNESQIKIWSTDTASTNNYHVIAVLLDNGNLVLRNGSGSNSNNFTENLWESFNNPTDTWMPGAKLAYDKRTHRKQVLTSWRNSENPAPGLFTQKPDPNGRQYISIWNNSKQYWTSGPWNGRAFELVPEMNTEGIYNFSYIDNENGSYFIFKPYSQSLIPRYVMDVSGRAMMWLYVNTSWTLTYSQPRQQCDVYAYCGPFSTCNQNSLPFCSCLPGFKIKSDKGWSLKDYSGGCVREIDLQCENNGTNGDQDRFMMNSNVGLPEESQSLIVGSIGECESACLGNCSCMAYAYDENGCSIWFWELLNLQKLAEGDDSGKTIYVRLSASSSVFVSSKNDDKGVVIGSTVGSFAALLVLIATILAILRIIRKRAGISVEGTLVAFRYKDLQNATKNYSTKLGGGGFGYVYKGILPDSTAIAVKKLESIGQGDKQFRTEVSTIGKIHHVNLVRLRGFCLKPDKKMLVYDYMENGSLDAYLFSESKVLKWRTRYQIALGVARGLEYLHEKCRDCIIHCDVKPENILLDLDFCPKVGDFGMAKLVGRDFSRVLTTMRGTRGYLAPEWITGVAITAKADVYSYGMMLFELVSGRRNSGHSADGKSIFFPSLAARETINSGDIIGLLDPVLDGDADVVEVSRMCKVACWCVQDDENIRPSMGQVVQILEGVTDVNLPPMPRSLQMLLAAPLPEHVMFFAGPSSGPSSE